MASQGCHEEEVFSKYLLVKQWTQKDHLQSVSICVYLQMVVSGPDTRREPGHPHGHQPREVAVWALYTRSCLLSANEDSTHAYRSRADRRSSIVPVRRLPHRPFSSRTVDESARSNGARCGA